MMSEKDHSPLSPACVRALQEKLYDKRKAAALEIEKYVIFGTVDYSLTDKLLLGWLKTLRS